MILTVTPNPTIDRVLFVRNFAMQDVVRAEREVVTPSGKGIDISLVLHAMGEATHALALRAGRHGALLSELLKDAGLPLAWIEAGGETRMATLLTDVVMGRQSTILAHTLHAAPEHLNQILDQIERLAPGAWGLATAGSLPPGLPENSHAELLRAAHAHGLVTLLDSSGAALVAGSAGVPHILKVNAAEFHALLASSRMPEPGDNSTEDEFRHVYARNGAHGPASDATDDSADDSADDTGPAFSDAHDEAMPLPQGEDFTGYDRILRLAEQIAPYVGQPSGTSDGAIPAPLAQEAVVVTLGRNGILAVTMDGVYHAPALPVQVVSPAGAGDAVSAGLLLARRRGDDWPTALLWATALAASVVNHAGTGECDPDQVRQLAEDATVVELDTY